MRDCNIYTDGASRGNPGESSWAFVVYDGAAKKGSKSGYLGVSTNNKAEMRAVLEALTWSAKFGIKPTIFIDSNYCKQGLESWMHSWQRKGWVKGDGKPPENLDLWKQLFDLYNQVKPNLVKVKGHSNVEGNLAADALCNVVLDEREFNEKF